MTIYLIEKLERDGCPLCKEAAEELRHLRKKRHQQVETFNHLQRKYRVLSKRFEEATGKEVSKRAKRREQAADREFLDAQAGAAR